MAVRSQVRRCCADRQPVAGWQGGGRVPMRLDLAPVGLASGVLVGGDTTAAALPVARALIAALLGEPGWVEPGDLKIPEDSE